MASRKYPQAALAGLAFGVIGPLATYLANLAGIGTQIAVFLTFLFPAWLAGFLLDLEIPPDGEVAMHVKLVGTNLLIWAAVFVLVASKLVLAVLLPVVWILLLYWLGLIGYDWLNELPQLAIGMACGTAAWLSLKRQRSGLRDL